MVKPEADLEGITADQVLRGRHARRSRFRGDARPQPLGAFRGRSGARPRHTRLGVAFGPRFFVLLGVGLIWLGPAFVDCRFLYRDVRLGRTGARWRGCSTSAACPAPIGSRSTRTWLGAGGAVGRVVDSPGSSLFNDSARHVRAQLLDARAASAVAASPPTVSLIAAAPRRSRGRLQRSSRPSAATRRSAPRYLRYQTPLRLAERWAVARTGADGRDLSEPRRGQARVDLPGAEPADRTARRAVASRSRGAGACFREPARVPGRRRVPRHLLDGERPARKAGHAALRNRAQPDDLGRARRGPADARARRGASRKLDHAVNAALDAGAGRARIRRSRRAARLRPDRSPSSARGARTARTSGRSSIIWRWCATDEWEADHLQAAGRLLTDQKRRVLDRLDHRPGRHGDDAGSRSGGLAPDAPPPRALRGDRPAGSAPHRRRASRTRARPMFETAAAQEVVHRREIAARAASRQAARWRSRPAGDLSPALVNAYLDVKQRNRL